jgi:hypothetical protein
MGRKLALRDYLIGGSRTVTPAIKAQSISTAITVRCQLAPRFMPAFCANQSTVVNRRCGRGAAPGTTGIFHYTDASGNSVHDARCKPWKGRVGIFA